MKNLTTAGLLTGLITMVLFGCSKENDDSNNSTYHPFLVPGKIWSEGADIPWGEEPGLHFNKIDKIGSDTIVEGIKWYKYYVSYDEDPVNFRLYGFLHEDSTKIYFKWATDNAISTTGFTRLLYDFSLEVGDEIQLEPWQPDEWLFYFVYKVDSVKYLPIHIFNPMKRKHIFLSPKHLINNTDDYVVWIEGIGSNYGAIENESINGRIGGVNVLLCCKENGSYIYQNTEFNVCYLGPND
jgi:hypothetical protein